MYDVYFWTTPNGYKILLFMEESGLPYAIKPINIGRGDQFDPAFLKIAPNNRIPALVDREPDGGGPPVSVFESGAILLYLAEKHRRFIYPDLRGRVEVLQWLFWQMGGLGPMAGQNHHFGHYAPEKLPYAIERYVKRLADRAFMAGDHYTIADMATYPWVVPYKRQQQTIEDFPHLKRWFDAIAARPATKRAYDKGAAINVRPTVSDEEAKKILFGQTAKVVR
jgi:GST-like protein